ncbi:MAG: hypothetical protein RI562_11295 [Salibacter sp.]|uniref:Ppx/GppA phosphatase family protein n=1 Tax=Salibacter sp. TaxID=2010995 RepID=UPI0028707563|nr:hypothetical protein [Salibacter sp.]MDR9399636.1 hypothetical protein [Salibacter sp.]
MIDLTAIIDMGSNTFNLLVVRENEDGTPLYVYKTKKPVKLGQGGIGQNRIADDAIERAHEAIESFVSVAKGYECATIKAFATSAIRSAENGSSVIDQLSKEYGLNIEVIDGLREAQLIYKGARAAVELTEKPALIMDIGGGSVEFILANRETVFWQNSYDLGITRLREKFNIPDKIEKIDRENLEFFLDQTTNELFESLAQYPANTLIGASGSFEAFAKMIEAQKENAFDEKASSYEFGDEFQPLIDALIGSDREKRESWPGLEEMRIDTIHIAACLVRYLLDKKTFEHHWLSQFALKEGAWFEIKAQEHG